MRKLNLTYRTAILDGNVLVNDLRLRGRELWSNGQLIATISDSGEWIAMSKTGGWIAGDRLFEVHVRAANDGSWAENGAYEDGEIPPIRPGGKVVIL